MLIGGHLVGLRSVRAVPRRLGGTRSGVGRCRGPGQRPALLPLEGGKRVERSRTRATGDLEHERDAGSDRRVPARRVSRRVRASGPLVWSNASGLGQRAAALGGAAPARCAGRHDLSRRPSGAVLERRPRHGRFAAGDRPKRICGGPTAGRSGSTSSHRQGSRTAASSGLWFAPGVGLVRWVEQTIARPDRACPCLGAAYVNGSAACGMSQARRQRSRRRQRGEHAVQALVGERRARRVRSLHRGRTGIAVGAEPVSTRSTSR